MVIFDDGSFIGTVGGDALKRHWAEAREVLRSGNADIYHFNLAANMKTRKVMVRWMMTLSSSDGSATLMFTPQALVPQTPVRSKSVSSLASSRIWRQSHERAVSRSKYCLSVRSSSPAAIGIAPDLERLDNNGRLAPVASPPRAADELAALRHLSPRARAPASSSVSIIAPSETIFTRDNTLRRNTLNPQSCRAKITEQQANNHLPAKGCLVTTLSPVGR
jgi:hypothetical protein